MDEVFEEMLSTTGWVDGVGIIPGRWAAAPPTCTAMDTTIVSTSGMPLGPSMSRMSAMPFMSPSSCELGTEDLNASTYDSTEGRQPHIRLSEGRLPVGTMHLNNGALNVSRGADDLAKSICDGHGFQQATHSLQQIPIMAAPVWQQSYVGGLSAPLIPRNEGAFDIGIRNDVCLGKRPREEDEAFRHSQPDNAILAHDVELMQGFVEQSLLVPDPTESSGAGIVRPRVRARRGQATDPHSIAERNRRERIAERMKALQELVPDANKTDKASMLDEIIGYVKFLQMQVKCLSMCRLGGTGAVSPVLADLPAEGAASFLAANLAQANTGVGCSQDGMAFAEGQVARLMDEDMSAAMQYLQSKGLCLMPISLATAISSSGARQAPPPPTNIQPSKGVGCSEEGGVKQDVELHAVATAAAVGAAMSPIRNASGKDNMGAEAPK